MKMRLAKKIDVKVGDWVHCQGSGVWRVLRVLKGFQELRYRAEEPSKPSRRALVFCKRLLSDRWKQSFTAETCEVALVSELAEGEKERLAQFIQDHPGTLKAFEEFTPASADFAMDLRLNLPEPIDDAGIIDSLRSSFPAMETDGYTNSEVVDRFAESQIGRRQSAGFGNRTIRFLCRDHELRDGEFVFREMSVLPF